MRDFQIDRVQTVTTLDLYCNTQDAEKVGNWLTAKFPDHRLRRNGPQVTKDMKVVMGRRHFIVELSGVHDLEQLRQQMEAL